MYIENLIEVFKKAVSEYPELNGNDVLDLVRKGIEAKKYDLQDEGLIEAILREDKKDIGILPPSNHIPSILLNWVQK